MGLRSLSKVLSARAQKRLSRPAAPVLFHTDGKTAVKICHVVEIEVEPVLRRRHGAKEPLDHVIHSKPRPDGNRILSVKQFQFALCGDQRASGIRRNAISFAADKYIGQNAELKPDGGGGAAPGLHADIKAVVHRRDVAFTFTER